MRSQLSSQSAELGLPLTEELEVEVPDALNRPHPAVRMLFMSLPLAAAGMTGSRGSTVPHW